MKRISMIALVLSLTAVSCYAQAKKNNVKQPALAVNHDVKENNIEGSAKQNTTSSVNGLKNTPTAMKSIYDYVVTDIDGHEFNFEMLKGKKIMIVNTASKCGFTPQYADLQKLYEKYKDANFVIVGFPANDFGKQEPGSDAEIHDFCQLNYGVTFPMMSKISVVGDGMADIYKFLTNQKLNGLQNSTVQWNFQKYLINEKGQLEKVLLSKVSPTDPEIINWINK